MTATEDTTVLAATTKSATTDTARIHTQKESSKKETAKPDIIRQLVEMRHKKCLTQAQVAVQMGTTASAVARLESGGGRKRHSPSLRTLKLYAEAIGCEIAMTVIAAK